MAKRRLTRVAMGVAVLGGLALLGACASMSGARAVRAPEPARPLTAEAFYTGRWYEIGRTPMRLTDGCVAGTTDYVSAAGKLTQRDACRSGTPAGKEKVVKGAITILNPGENTKIRVDYRLFGLLPVPRTYWILDHGDDWFIQSDPALKNFNLYTRDPRPSPERVAQLKARVAATGYDVGLLEFPTTFPG